MDKMTAAPNRRWYQFTLRWLFFAFLLFSIPLGWVTYKFRNADRQRRVVELIRGLGGDIEYDYEYDDYRKWASGSRDGDWWSSPPSPGPDSICELLGYDLFMGLTSHAVASVDFWRDDIDHLGSENGRFAVDLSDDNLRLLQDFPGLRTVRMEFQPISDVGISHLRTVRSIEELDLYGTRITDGALRTIAELPKLKVLNVGGTQVTPQAIAAMIGKTKIKSLILSSDQIKSAGGANNLETIFPNVDITRYDASEDGSSSMGTP